MIGHLLRCTFAVVGALGAVSCAGLGNNFKAPDVVLDHVVVRGLGVRGGTLDLVVGVYNPNGFALQGTKLRLGLDVETSHVGDITYDHDFAVTSNDTTRVTLPLTFQWSGVGGAVRKALDYGDIPYTIAGEVQLTTPSGAGKVPFTHSGRALLTRPGGGVGVPGTTP